MLQTSARIVRVLLWSIQFWAWLVTENTAAGVAEDIISSNIPLCLPWLVCELFTDTVELGYLIASPPLQFGG